jgi:uncharacterized protein (DUF2147 family)
VEGDQIVGTWLNETQDGKIEVFKSGDHYAARLIWSDDMFEADGKTSKPDVHNVDTSLRHRPLHNILILDNCIYHNGVWDGGTVYDPDSGKIYKCILHFKDGKLSIRGYIGAPMFGETVVWERIKM